MNGLGMISQTYMFILLVLLFVGSGMAVWSFLNFMIDKSSNKLPTKEKKVIVSSDPSKAGSTVKKYGGIVMNNGWLKLAVFSFVGILVSVIVLGFVSASGANTMNMAGSAMTGNSIHQQHPQQGMAQNGMQMQGTMNPNMQMGNMQGNMNGNMQMQGNMSGMTGQQPGNEYMMMQQINQMQMQLNQIQQQMGMMNGNMSGNMQMQPGGMSSMPQSGGMSSMPQSGGMGMGMGMMPMMNMGGSMSSMPQSGSGGGMSMM